MNEQNYKSDTGAGYRIASLAAIIIAALAIAVIPFQAITSVTKDGIESLSLLNLVMKAVKGSYTIFGALPAFALTGTIGTVYNLAIYMFFACLVTSAVVGLIGLFSGKGSIARASVCFLGIGAAIYSISINLAYTNFFIDPANAADLNKINLDFISLAVAMVGAILYLVMSLPNIGKVAWVHFVQFILSVVFVALVSRPLAVSPIFKANKLSGLPMIAMYLGLFVVYVNTIIALARISRAGGMVADLVRFIIVLLSALLITFAAKEHILWSLIAVAVATLQIVIIIIQIVKSNKKAVEKAAKDAGEAAVAGFHTEEYAEAYAYEGGPVAGVMMAEEVNPSFLPQNPHVNTAGYDFYNCKSFDPFIASLDNAERNEFTEIFILKFKGTMPELPDYEVGGDNKDFFRKIFIYLGQYRDRISQELLMKMYQYSMKI